MESNLARLLLCVGILHASSFVHADALGKDLGFVIGADGPRDASLGAPAATGPNARAANATAPAGKRLQIVPPAEPAAADACDPGGQPCARAPASQKP
ncbi:MAG: hypothetical protein ACOY3X_11925 [Pseudomonadota bacterium]